MTPSMIVLPTCVGMVRSLGMGLYLWGRSPHVRGDGPQQRASQRAGQSFSPRAWGWSGPRAAAGLGRAVLPTCVGMVRQVSLQRRTVLRSPHVRGDGPLTLGERLGQRPFSPRAWGWSGVRQDRPGATRVLPTCVGMVLIPLSMASVMVRSPHVRGDGPFPNEWLICGMWFSPRAWGWSENLLRGHLPSEVLPTCVGMVRKCKLTTGAAVCSPHVRGDGPQLCGPVALFAEFSPRAWGWSVNRI